MKRDNRFEIVIMAAQRCRQLMRGAKPRIKTTSTKPTSIAVEEVMAEAIEVVEEAGDESGSENEREGADGSS